MEAISNILLRILSWVSDLAPPPSIFTLLISLNLKKPCLWPDLCSVLSLLPFCLLISFSFPDHHRTTQKCFCTFPSWYLLAMTVPSSFRTLFFVPHLQSKSRTCPHSSWKLEPDLYTMSFSKILINSWQTLYIFFYQFLPAPGNQTSVSQALWGESTRHHHCRHQCYLHSSTFIVSNIIKLSISFIPYCCCLILLLMLDHEY